MLNEREWCLWSIITLRARGKKKMLSFRIRSRLNNPPISSQIMSEYSIHGALGRLRNRPGETRLKEIFFTLHRETFASLIARKHLIPAGYFSWFLLALFVSLVDAWRDFHISCLMSYIHYTRYTLFSYTSFCHLHPQIRGTQRGYSSNHLT